MIVKVNVASNCVTAKMRSNFFFSYQVVEQVETERKGRKEGAYSDPEVEGVDLEREEDRA